MKKFSKVVLASALAVGLGLGGAGLAGCGDKSAQAKLEVVQEFKDEYYMGESVDTTGAIFSYTDEEGKTIHLLPEDVTISGFFSTTAGEWNMVIKYEDTTMLYPYTVIEPAFVQYGVPYYVSVEAMGAPADIMHSVFIFTEDGKIEMWTTSILPTVNNKDEIFKSGVEGSTCAGIVEEYEKEVVDRKYVVSFDMEMDGPTPPIETTVIIEDENTISVEQIYDSDPFVITLKAVGNEDEVIEYGAYYVYEDMSGVSSPWAVICVENDGKMSMYTFSEEPTIENIESLVAQAREINSFEESSYCAYIEDGQFTINSEGRIITVNNDGSLNFVIGVTMTFTKLA